MARGEKANSGDQWEIFGLDRRFKWCRPSNSGAGTIFQQGGQDQPFPAGGLGAL